MQPSRATQQQQRGWLQPWGRLLDRRAGRKAIGGNSGGGCRWLLAPDGSRRERHPCPVKAHRTERFLAAANALAGNIDEARRVMGRILQTDSVLRLSNFRTYTSVRRPADIETMLEGLRLAGLPE